MMDRPDKVALLDAVALFLLTEVQPRIAETDKALAFRVLIAANLAQIVAQEVRGEEAQNAAQLGRLAALLPELAPPPLPQGAAAQGALIRLLEGQLCAAVREGAAEANDPAADPADPVWTHAVQTLREKLAVINPRFDTAAEIE